RGDPCDIAAGSCQTINKPRCDRILSCHYDNRNCLRCFLGRADRRLRSKNKYIDFELHEFGHKAWHTVASPLNVANLKQDVLTLNVTEVSQCLAKRFQMTPRSIGGPNG